MKIKRMNHQGFTLVEGLIIVVVLVAVAGLSVVGYKQLKKNDKPAGASSYTFIHHVNQMGGAGGIALQTESYGGITYAKKLSSSVSPQTRVSTFVAATELTGATKVCIHYRDFGGNGGLVGLGIWDTSNNAQFSGAVAMHSLVASGTTGNACQTISSRKTGYINVQDNAQQNTRYNVGIDTIYGLR